SIHGEIPPGLWARAALIRIMSQGGAPAQEVRASIERTAVPAVRGGGSLDDRARAAVLAADIENPAGTQVLTEAATGASDVQLRFQCIYALGAVGDASAVPVLAGLLRQPDKTTSNLSYRALTEAAARGVPEAQHALEAYHGLRPEKPAPVTLPFP